MIDFFRHHYISIFSWHIYSKIYWTSFFFLCSSESRTIHAWILSLLRTSCESHHLVRLLFLLEHHQEEKEIRQDLEDHLLEVQASHFRWWTLFILVKHSFDRNGFIFFRSNRIESKRKKHRWIVSEDLIRILRTSLLCASKAQNSWLINMKDTFTHADNRHSAKIKNRKKVLMN